MSHFLFLAAIPHHRLSLIFFHKHTTSYQDLQYHCTKFFSFFCAVYESWLELVFLRSEIRKRRGWAKVLADENKKYETEFWSGFNHTIQCL